MGLLRVTRQDTRDAEHEHMVWRLFALSAGFRDPVDFPIWLESVDVQRRLCIRYFGWLIRTRA